MHEWFLNKLGGNHPHRSLRHCSSSFCVCACVRACERVALPPRSIMFGPPLMGIPPLMNPGTVFLRAIDTFSLRPWNSFPRRTETERGVRMGGE